MSVITYSNPGDVTAELVWVGEGTSDDDYDGKDVTGKFVLATGYGGSVHRMAVLKYGAAAVVCFLDDDRAKEYPDMLQYTGMWPRANELDQVTFGFNIANRQGERLRDMLLGGGRVVMRGTVKGTGLEPYFMDVVVARIEGSERPEEELVFSAHLDHPKESANDNASGSAALLDIAQTLRRLINSGRLSPPKRSLRFLWVPEWYGTMAYIDRHQEVVGPALGGTWLANLNMDMVGEHLELIHSRLILTRTPASISSGVNDVVANMAQMVDGMEVRTARGSLSAMNYRVTPYAGGSDHMMFIDRKIPGIMFSHSPDYTHHTSEDTPDKVDPVELERSEIIAAATILYLSDLTVDQGVDMVHLVGANGGAAARRASRLMMAASGDERDAIWFEAENTVTHAARWEKEAVGYVLHFNGADPIRAAVQVTHRQIEQQENVLLEALRAEAQSAGIHISGRSGVADGRVPVRVTRGPLDFSLPESRLTSEDAAWYSSPEFPLTGNARFELVNFIDGERSVQEIRDALSAEFGPVSVAVVARYLEDGERSVQEIRDALSAEFGPVSVAVVARYLEDLVSVGVMAWK